MARRAHRGRKIGSSTATACPSDPCPFGARGAASRSAFGESSGRLAEIVYRIAQILPHTLAALNLSQN
jgi:hypothetical protein